MRGLLKSSKPTKWGVHKEEWLIDSSNQESSRLQVTRMEPGTVGQKNVTLRICTVLICPQHEYQSKRMLQNFIQRLQLLNENYLAHSGFTRLNEVQPLGRFSWRIFSLCSCTFTTHIENVIPEQGAWRMRWGLCGISRTIFACKKVLTPSVKYLAIFVRRRVKPTARTASTLKWRSHLPLKAFRPFEETIVSLNYNDLVNVINMIDPKEPMWSRGVLTQNILFLLEEGVDRMVCTRS